MNFELLPWQDKIIRDLFKTVKDNGYRQYNTAYVEIPKKNGKSELVAAIALYLTCGDNEYGAEVYGCASDRQQRSIAFIKYVGRGVYQTRIECARRCIRRNSLPT